MASWVLLRWKWSVLQVIGAAALVGLLRLALQQLHLL
jgi:hypothetical protein